MAGRPAATDVMSPKDAEEYTQSLSQVLGGGWRQILLAKELGVPESLGLTVKDWVETRLGGYIRHSIADRQEASKELVEKEGFNNCEAAEILGVNEITVRRDLDSTNVERNGISSRGRCRSRFDKCRAVSRPGD